MPSPIQGVEFELNPPPSPGSLESFCAIVVEDEGGCFFLLFFLIKDGKRCFFFFEHWLLLLLLLLLQLLLLTLLSDDIVDLIDPAKVVNSSKDLLLGAIAELSSSSVML